MTDCDVNSTSGTQSNFNIRKQLTAEDCVVFDVSGWGSTGGGGAALEYFQF